MRFLHFDQLGSTQDKVRELYLSGDRGPVWVRAETQTQGRGRRDRIWISRRGNLYASLLLPNNADPGPSALVGFAASVAIARTISDYNPERPVTLKWPNDVLVGGAKISGLLIERERDALLIGIGVNLISSPTDTSYPTTYLVQEMHSADLNGPDPLYTGASAVLALLSKHIMSEVTLLQNMGFEPVRQNWLHRAHHLGETVTVNGRTGTFTDLAMDGALCLALLDGTETRVHAGDVSFG